MALSLVPAVMVEEAEEAALAALKRVVQKDKRVSDLALGGIATFLNARRHEKDFLLYHREFGFKEARARYVTRVQTSTHAQSTDLGTAKAVLEQSATHKS